MKRKLVVVLIAAGASSLAACSKKAPEVLPPPPGGATDVQAPSSGAVGAAPGSHADFLAHTNGQNTIYFDTDRYNIDTTDASALRTQAAWLAQYPQKRAVIEGHADERGTREYNIALGERRANAARAYLASLGIDSNRLSVISYGKERPIALNSDESSWARNRRAVTVTID